MKDFPSCFGENGVQVADFSSSSSSSSSSGGKQTAQNSVTCLYQSLIRGRPCLITVTWSKSLMGQSMTMVVDGATICKVEVKPWLFAKKKGSKAIDINDCDRVEVLWDLSSARYGSGPEPLDGYYIALVVNSEMVLLLGDLRKEAFRKTNSSSPGSSCVFLAKREHIFSRSVYCTKARFRDSGRIHDISIECETAGQEEPRLSVQIDEKMVLQVKRLAWKFRGNQTVLVDGLPVEIFWDVHNWLFGHVIGSAVFMFRTAMSMELSSSDSFSDLSPVSPWQALKERKPQASLGFSLILYAWKNE
ncbi:unnamed protein product [Victoria cruziana]